VQKWTVIERNYIYKTPFGNLRSDKVVLPNNQVIENYYVNEYPDWVNIVAITKNYEILLVKQYRHGCEDFFIEIPAGKVDEKEDSASAVMRELREETGYTSDVPPLKLGRFYTNPAVSNNTITTYFIKDCYKISEQKLDPTENVELLVIPVSEFEKMIKEGVINQLFTVFAYTLAKNCLNNVGR
jgi:ADP-ribose pyrophosphatase